jgi:threonine synthase
MDIQISSNFERLLFEASGRDGALVTRLMDQLRTTGAFDLTPAMRGFIADRFAAERVTKEEAAAEMARIFRERAMVIDPHTAIGLVAARRRQRRGVPMVALATAHPGKFPDAVEAAIGEKPNIPRHLAEMASLPERCDTLPADPEPVRAYIEAFAQTRTS